MRRRWIRHLTVLVVAGALTGQVHTAEAANPQPDPPSKPRVTAPADPAVLTAFDQLKADIGRVDGLNRGQRTSLIAKLDSAEKKYRSEQACAAADHFKPYLNETEAMAKTGKGPGLDLQRKGFALRQFLLSHLPSGMACGIGISWIVDPAVKPSRATLGGDPNRPVGRVVDNRGKAIDFITNEVMVRGSAADAAQLAARWGGQVLNTVDVPGALGISLVRIDTARGNTTALAADLQTMNGGPDGVQSALQFSDTAAAKLISIAARERVAGADVGMNGLGTGDGIADGHTTEAPTGPVGFITPLSDYSSDAFRWNSLRPAENDDPVNDRFAQRTNVTQAWQFLQNIGRLDPVEPFALEIHDGGFSSLLRQDLSGRIFSIEDENVPNDVGCGDNNPCLWHGTMTMSAAAATVDDSFGGAGPAGVLSRRFDPTASIWAGDFFDTVLDSINTFPSDIFSMSYSGEFPATLAVFLYPLEGIIAVSNGGGITYVASAGNKGENVDDEDCFIVCWESGYTFPCESAGVICVGALTRSFRSRASYSSYGGDVDIWAPGEFLVGPNPDNPGNITRQGSGTSAATPFISGVAALIMAANRTTINNEERLYDALIDTATPEGGVVTRVVDAYAAVRRVTPRLVNITSPSEGTSFHRGRPTDFTAFVHDPQAQVPSVEWVSDRDGVVGHGGSFRAMSLSFGPHRITVNARFADGTVVTDSINVTVTNEAPTVEILAPVEGTSVLRRGTLRLEAHSFDPNQLPSSLADSQITWLVDGAVVATGHRSAYAVGDAAPGPHTLTVRGTDGEFTAEDSMTFSVSSTEAQLPTAVIVSPDDGASFVPTEFNPGTGEYTTLVQFNGRGIDPQDGELSPASFRWTATVTGDDWEGTIEFGRGTANPTLRVSTRDDGSAGEVYVIRFYVTDADGHESMSSITIRTSVLF